MGTYAHNFYGYAIDVTNEYNEIKNDYYHLFEEDEAEDKEILEKIELSGIKAYWIFKNDFKKGDITFLYDGISGEYAKLIYIIKEEDYANNEYYEELVLKDKIQDDKAKLKLKESYEKLFSKDLENIEIELIKFSHFH